MRCVVGMTIALGFGLGMAQSASAADYWPLRGSTYNPPRVRSWEGFYVGGQVGTGGGGANFGSDVANRVAYLTRNTWLQAYGVQDWTTTKKPETGQALQYGFFIGYNLQWDNLVIGIDASYNHTNLSAADGDPVSRYIDYPNDPATAYRYFITVDSRSVITLNDFGTIRGRAGYAIGNFLPYITTGVALGRASYSTMASVKYPAPTYVGTDPHVPANDPPGWSASDTQGKSNALIYGWSAGLGVDIALMSNVFLRAEYEFIQFSQSKLNLSNARVGAGVKF
jgi:outer membrane immunogenic protein